MKSSIKVFYKNLIKELKKEGLTIKNEKNNKKVSIIIELGIKDFLFLIQIKDDELLVHKRLGDHAANISMGKVNELDKEVIFDIIGEINLTKTFLENYKG